MKKITRKEYMENSSELFNAYYSQFITQATTDFILRNIGMEKLRSSKCEHLNDLYKHSNNGAGGWIWDCTPINLDLARELGEVSAGYLPSPAFHTCVGKVCAKNLLNAEK